MEKNLIEDLSKLFSIKPSLLKKLAKVADYCISDYILESKLNDEDVTDINIGIGELKLVVVDDSLTYQFIPSKKLETMIVDAYQKEKSEMTIALEDGLESRLLSAYKELL